MFTQVIGSVARRLAAPSAVRMAGALMRSGYAPTSVRRVQSVVGFNGVLLPLDEPQKVQQHLFEMMEKVTRAERQMKEVALVRSQLESAKRQVRFLQADLMRAHRELLVARKMLHCVGVIDWIVERTRMSRPRLNDASLVDVLTAWFNDNKEIAQAASKRSGISVDRLGQAVADTHNFLVKGEQFDPDEAEAVLIGRPLSKAQGTVLEEICRGMQVPFRVTVYPGEETPASS